MFAFIVPKFFIHLDSVIYYLQSTLKFKVEPGFVGGDIMARFNDPFDDDNGAGTLTYPKHQAWNEKGSLDLVRYTVHSPVSRALWFSMKKYWQLDLTFAALSNPLNGQAGFSFPVIQIYIDINGDKSGSLETSENRAELVRFSPDAPWDFAVHINGYNQNAILQSADGNYKAEAPIFIDHGTNTVKVRLPLDRGALLQVLSIPESKHYVIVGAYDQLGRSNFMSVNKRGGVGSGGGALSRITPKVYDYLAPKKVSQKELLNSYNEEEYLYAMLEPITVSEDIQNFNTISEARLEELKLAAQLENKNSKKKLLTIEQIRRNNSDSEKQLITLFSNGFKQEAFALAEELLAVDSENGLVLSYYASLTAMKGGEAESLGESLRLVNEAFEIFEHADRLLTTASERLHLHLNRGYVCQSVPELVFQKNSLGAKDFLTAAEIYMAIQKQATDIANVYMQAGFCFENANQFDKAELSFNRAFSQNELSAELRYKLALKGYVDF